MALGEGELGAFRAYADVYPDDCLLLVDTINTLESGVPNAIRVFEELRRKGHEPVGIRLDSGDLAYLSIQAARLLDAAGFPDTHIVLSNDLDELVIWQILTQITDEAPRYGVDAGPADQAAGLRRGHAADHLARRPGAGRGVQAGRGARPAGAWLPAIKLSESPEKTPNPGHKHVWRIYDARGKATADLLSLDGEDPRQMPRLLLLHHPTDSYPAARSCSQADITASNRSRSEMLREGRRVYRCCRPSRRCAPSAHADLDRLDPGVRRLLNPHIYHVSLTPGYGKSKQHLIATARDQSR